MYDVKKALTVLFSVMAPMFVGYFLSMLNPSNDLIGFIIFFSILLLVILIVINIVYSRHFVKKFGSAHFKDWFLQKRQESEDDILTHDVSIKALGKLQRFGVLYTVLLVMVHVFLIALLFTTLFLYEDIHIGALIGSVYSLIGVLFGFVEPPENIGGFYVDENLYPKLFDIVDKVKKDLNFKKKIRIVLVGSSNFSITNQNGRHYLIIGLGSLMMLNEKELESVIVHELGHVINKDTSNGRKRFNYFGGVERIVEHNQFFYHTRFFYQGLHMYYSLHKSLHEVVISKEIETRADEIVRAAGYKEDFITASLKIAYFAFFDNKYGVKAYTQEREEQTPYFVDELFAEFKEALLTKETVYRSYIENEVSSKRSSHPSLKERMEYVDYHDFTLTPFESYDEKEVRAFIKAFQEVNEFTKSQYKHSREQGYLKMCQAKETFEEDPKDDTASKLQYLDALFGLLETEKAYEYAKKLKDEEPELAFPYYVIGMIDVFINNDLNGLDDLVKAAEKHVNFSGVLDLVGDYIRFTGDKEKIDSTRNTYFKLFEKYTNRKRINVALVKRFTKLEKATLKPEVEETLRRYAEEGNMKFLYAAKKKLNEFENATLIIVEPTENDDDFNNAMDNIFFVLDQEDGEYGLLINTRLLKRKLKRFDSIVYKKEN